MRQGEEEGAASFVCWLVCPPLLPWLPSLPPSLPFIASQNMKLIYAFQLSFFSLFVSFHKFKLMKFQFSISDPTRDCGHVTRLATTYAPRATGCGTRVCLVGFLGACILGWERHLPLPSSIFYPFIVIWNSNITANLCTPLTNLFHYIFSNFKLISTNIAHS
jgi:hypothetical protein